MATLDNLRVASFARLCRIGVARISAQRHDVRFGSFEGHGGLKQGGGAGGRQVRHFAASGPGEFDSAKKN